MTVDSTTNPINDAFSVATVTQTLRERVVNAISHHARAHDIRVEENDRTIALHGRCSSFFRLKQILDATMTVSADFRLRSFIEVD